MILTDISKLPKWAQEAFRSLRRERDTAVRELAKYCDSQTPAPFCFPDYVSDGESSGPTLRKRFVSAHRMSLEHGGIHLEVTLRDNVIDLQYNAMDARYRYGVILQPRSYQQLYLLMPPKDQP